MESMDQDKLMFPGNYGKGHVLEYVHREMDIGNEILATLHKLQQENYLCDVTILVNDDEFHCHRAVLTASCPYIKALFDHQPSRMTEATIKLDDVSKSGFSEILNFMYTGISTINLENVYDIIEAADFLQFRSIVDSCNMFLMQHVNADTCLRICVVAASHGCRGLAHYAMDFACKHFLAVVHSVDFVNLSEQQLEDYLADPRLAVGDHGEAAVLTAICRWIDHSQDDRKEHLDTFLSALHFPSGVQEEVAEDFPHLFPSLVKTVVQENEEEQEEAENTAETKRMDEGDEIMLNYDDAVAMGEGKTKKKIVKKKKSTVKSSGIYKTIQGTVGEVYDDDNIVRLKRLQEVIILVPSTSIGKSFDRMVPVIDNAIYYCHPKSMTWKKLTCLPLSKTVAYSSTVSQRQIYITGGLYADQAVLNQASYYDMALDSWTSLPNMIKPRYNHSSASIHGDLYVFGGCHKMLALADARPHLDGEVFNRTTRQWTRLPSPPEHAHFSAHIPPIVVYNDLLVIEGPLGWSAYNTDTREWIGLTDSKYQPGNEQRCLVLNGMILVVHEKNKNFYMWNLLTGQSHDHHVANAFHKLAGYALYKDNVVCIGGATSQGAHDQVCQCDITTTGSRFVTLPYLPQASSQHACYTVYMDTTAK